MDDLRAPNHPERILMALSKVPVATTRQLATLNQSLDPIKKAGMILRELEQEKMITWRYHGREKVWSLDRKGRQQMKVAPTRLFDLAHALAVGNLYFTMRPDYWMMEPRERFEHDGHKFVWAPDCILVHEKKVYAVEVQQTPLGKKRWERKWSVYNAYFNGGYFKEAAFQRWSSRPILPQFLCMTNQKPETARHGFAVRGRELTIMTLGK